MKKKDWLAGLGLIGACALCCALPLLGGAAIIGLSTFFLNPIVIVILTLLFVVSGVFIYQRRKAIGASCQTQGCNCNSCASGRNL